MVNENWHIVENEKLEVNEFGNSKIMTEPYTSNYIMVDPKFLEGLINQHNKYGDLNMDPEMLGELVNENIKLKKLVEQEFTEIEKWNYHENIKGTKYKEYVKKETIFLYCSTTKHFIGYFKNYKEALKIKNEKYEDAVNRMLKKMKNDITKKMLNLTSEKDKGIIQCLSRDIRDMEDNLKRCKEQIEKNGGDLRINIHPDFQQFIYQNEYSMYRTNNNLDIYLI